MPNASLSVLLSWVSAIVRLLLTNTTGDSTELSGALLNGWFQATIA